LKVLIAEAVVVAVVVAAAAVAAAMPQGGGKKDDEPNELATSHHLPWKYMVQLASADEMTTKRMPSDDPRV
jgi:hypothetical protein